MFLLSLNSEIRDFDTKKTTPNIEVCPDSLGAMLEYWYIECGQLSPKNELRFLWLIKCLNDINKKLFHSKKGRSGGGYSENY